MQGLAATKRHGVTRKRSTNKLKHTGIPFRKNLQLKSVCATERHNLTKKKRSTKKLKLKIKFYI